MNHNKFLFAILGALAMLLAPCSVSAFTVEDLCNPQLIGVDRLHWSFYDGNADYTENGPLGSSNEIKFERVYNTNAGRYYDDRVILRGIIINPSSGSDLQGMTTRSLAYQFMLADDENNVTTDGTRLILDCSHYDPQGYEFDNYDLDYNQYSICKGSKWHYEYFDEYYYNFNNSYQYKQGYWEGEISKDENGIIHIDFEKPVIVVNTDSDTEKYNIFRGSVMDMFYHRIIDGYHIDLMEYNAMLSGKVAAYNKKTNTTGTFSTPVAHDPYRCLVRFTDSSKFEIINLTENGYSVVPLEAGEVGNKYKTAAITGGYYEPTKEAWLDGGQIVYNSARTSGGDRYQHNPFQLNLANIYRDNTTKKFDFEDVVGTATTSGSLAHRLKDTHWVTNGGTLRTFEKAMSMTLPDFGYVYELDYVYDGTPIVRYEYSPCYCDNALDVYEGDVTLDLHHNLDAYGKPDDNDGTLIVETAVTPLNNTQYVDSYELWMMPKPTGTIDVNKGDFDHDNGHSKAYKLATHKPTASRSADDSFTFYRQVNIKDLPAESLHRKNEYMFFIKANYKEETGLHPTFHNLLATSDPDEVITGINNIKADGTETVSIETSHGEIIISAAGNATVFAEVFTPQGLLVYRGTDTRISVAPGLYIVRAASTTEKIFVQ